MCLTLVEILFFIAGVWLIFSGKVPEKLFKVLFGKGQYVLSSIQSRLFGLVLASPFPVVFTGSLLISAISGENNFTYYAIFETVYVVFVAIIAIVVAKKIRQPEIFQQTDIDKKTL